MCVEMTRFVDDRHAIHDFFRRLQKRFNPSRARRHALVLPVATRWYTVHACFRSVYNNMSTIEELFANGEFMDRFKKLARDKLAKVTGMVQDLEFWCGLKRVVGLLTPLIHGLRELESDDCSTSRVFTISKQLVEHKTFAGVQETTDHYTELHDKAEAELTAENTATRSIEAHMLLLTKKRLAHRCHGHCVPLGSIHRHPGFRGKG